jgi:thiamine transport system substrate-binding protein
MTRRKFPAPVALALALALGVGAGACGGDDDDDGTAVSPEKPGTVVLMTHQSFAMSKPVLRAFTNDTGWKVKILRSDDAGVALNQAILTKDQPVADAFFGVDNTFLSRALDEDIFEPYEAAGLDRVPDAFVVDPEHRVTPIDYGDVCLAYDRDWFGRDGRPTPPGSLDDLVDPAYRGLTVVENAASSSPGLAFLLATIAEYGDDGWQDYWRALRDNDVRVESGWEQAYYGAFTAGGGDGDRPIVVSYGSSPPADVVFADPPKSEPSIGVVESSCFRQIEFAGVLANAKHPEGARKLVDFMLSRRFQEDLPLQMYVFPVNPDASLPDVFERFAARPEHPFTMSPDRIDAHRDEWIEAWTDVVLR